MGRIYPRMRRMIRRRIPGQRKQVCQLQEILTSSVVNGIIYVIGGYNGAVLSTNEAYDPATNTWTTKASMPTARDALTSSVVNGIIYVIGGYNGAYLSTNEAYDPATNTWTTKASMPTARRWLTSSVVNGIIYVIGGYNGVFYPRMRRMILRRILGQRKQVCQLQDGVNKFGCKWHNLCDWRI
jgi:N-acetylneuraminic acid mutarotase